MRRRGRKRGRFFRAMIKAGALAKGDLASYRAKKLELKREKLSLFEKAKASGKRQGRWAKRIDRMIARLKKGIEKAEQKAAAKTPEAAPAAP